MNVLRWGLPPFLVLAILGIRWCSMSDTESTVCEPVVELRSTASQDSGRLACLEDIPNACRTPKLGDLVVVDEEACDVRAGGMVPSLRFLVGLKMPLNDMSAEDLTLLKGLGEKTAAAIIARRDALGGFSSLNQLLEIDGIGKSRFTAWRPYLTLSKSIENVAKALESSTDGD